MSESYWPWRSLRWRDCEGALIGVRRINRGQVEALVATGVHQGKRQIWTSNEGRIWGVPDWVWNQVAVGQMLAGQVMQRGLVKASITERERIIAIASGDTVSDPRDDAPLVFTGSGSDASLDERTPGLVGEMARLVSAWGWKIFPLPPGSKIPFGGSHGYKDAVASTDADKVGLHWEYWPDDNLALATGQHKSPVVIDIDPRNGGSIEVAEEIFGCPLGYTLMATTPSNGVHLYFKDPMQGKDGALHSVNSGGFPAAPGIEIKAAGRHVVMAPSTYGEGAYRFTTDPACMGPAVLPEAVRAAAKTASKRVVTFERPDPYGFAVPLDAIWAAVRASATNGRGRNNIVHEAACVLTIQCLGRPELRAGLQMLKDVATETQLPESEIDKAIRSALTTRRPEEADVLG